MKDKKILIIEDEEDIIELLKYNLVKSGFNVNYVMSGEEALSAVNKENPDLILLDLMLPGIDGLEVCRIIKNDSENLQIPIIMLTARGEEEDIIKGLKAGADDYITKPFSPKILLARIKTVLRRDGKRYYNPESIIQIDKLSINPEKHEVLIDDKPIKLSYSEFKTLHLLASNKGWVFTRYQIIDAIKSDEHCVTDRTVDVLLVGLRKKLMEFSSHIETVRGVGYRFKEL